ncbi:MAG: extracellular solute-binding protein [Spirochaetes bacterium]|uniref:Extracellular solute-binding protein n=1 Tax=Candidatus Ornithospirochaeta stercoripullorum TaxID=2840899 RepID=A0A9D9H5M9_9SPIO|nr:extracellular solute-binding protein [Candidatus Ornithospirochaeta stercoripullorum]
MRKASLIAILVCLPFVLSAESEIRFSFWGNEMRFKAMERAVLLYEERNPDVDIILDEHSYSDCQQAFRIRTKEGTLSDISAYDYKWTSWIEDEALSDLRDFPSLDISSLDESLLEKYSMKNSKIIGIPLGMNGLGLVYNEDFIERFSLSDPSFWTWDDIIENGSKVHEEDHSSYLFFVPDSQWHYIFRTFILQMSGHHIINEDGSPGCTVEDLEAALQFVLILIETGTIPDFGIGTLYENWLPQRNEMWINGKWGMTVASSSTVPDIASLSPFPVGTAPYPVEKDAIDSGVYAAPTMLLSISENSEHKVEAADFIGYLVHDTIAAAMLSDSCGLPVDKHNAKSVSADSLVYPMVISALENSAAVTIPYEMEDELQVVISEYVHMVGFRILTPDEAAKRMMDRIELISESFQNK